MTAYLVPIDPPNADSSDTETEIESSFPNDIAPESSKLIMIDTRTAPVMPYKRQRTSPQLPVPVQVIEI